MPLTRWERGLAGLFLLALGWRLMAGEYLDMVVMAGLGALLFTVQWLNRRA